MQALPDVLEAVVGAMFVDAEYNFSVVKAFFDKYFLPFFKDITLYDDFAGNHPVVSSISRELPETHSDTTYTKF